MGLDNHFRKRKLETRRKLRNFHSSVRDAQDEERRRGGTGGLVLHRYLPAEALERLATRGARAQGRLLHQLPDQGEGGVELQWRADDRRSTSHTVSPSLV